MLRAVIGAVGFMSQHAKKLTMTPTLREKPDPEDLNNTITEVVLTIREDRGDRRGS
jgi:hypothetical protein